MRIYFYENMPEMWPGVMTKEIIEKSIDGVYRVLIARENRLQGLWQHRFKYMYKDKDRTFRFYRKAVKLIHEIKKLRRIIFDLTYILSFKPENNTV